MFQSRMPTSLNKGSLVPDFLFSLLQLFTRVTVISKDIARIDVPSQCLFALRICLFALLTTGEGNGTGVQADIFMNFTTFFLLITFLPTTFYPHPPPHPLPTTHDPQYLVTLSLNRAFSHDVTAAILVFQNNKTAAMLVFQTNPVGVHLFSYVNTFFCVNKFAYVVVNFLSQVIFVFLLFLGMVIYANEVETKEK